MTSVRRAAAAAFTLGLVAAGVLVAAVPAEAASAYRYWSYWHVAPHATAWTYAGTGPGGYRVDDGGVEGWRFVVAAPNPAAPSPRSRAAKAFATICGSTPRPAGKDRVALLVDFGTSGDAPPKQTPPGGVRGTCVVVPDRSNGLDVLVAAGYDLRSDSSGLICGLSGYPARECGVIVNRPTASPTPTKPPTTKPSAQPTPAASRGATTGPRPSSRPTTSSAEGAPESPTPAGSPLPLVPTPSGSASPFTGEAGPDPSMPALALGPPPANPSGPAGGTPAGLLLGVGLIAAVGTAAGLRARRSPGTPDGTAA